jgi:release factor glutamine methyltransferase
MRCWPTNAPDNWPRVAETSFDPIAELVALGIERREARWLIEEFLPGGLVDEMPVVRAAAQRRLNGEPLQYIIGHWPFRSLDLDVDPRVLIPRPETEELVDVALSTLAHGSRAPLIVDLGCGSGAIGLSLLAELAARGVVATLVAVDESTDALAVAKRNALKHRLLSTSFVHSSWFDSLDPSLRGHIDLIVTNPPYIGEEEFATLDPVLSFEPLGALVAPDEGGTQGFADIAHILNEALSWLTPGGALVLEHGADQRDATLRHAREVGWVECEDLDDLSGRARMFVGRRP